MKLGDVDAELVARGFDMFTPEQRYQYINWGAAHVARKSTWYWEETSYDIGVPVGAWYVDLTAIPNFRSMRAVIQTVPSRRRLLPIRDDRLREYWLPRDLATERGDLTEYIVWGGKLRFFPPAQAAVTLTVHYYQRPTKLTNPTQSFITPEYLDEAIVTASLIRCHRRAQELDRARDLEMELESMFDDMRVDDDNENIEQIERVLPDNTWQ